MFEVIVLIIFVYILFSVLYWSLKTGISPMFTTPKVAQAIHKIVKNSKQKKVVDLGSGWGGLALYLAIKNPTKEVVGYELSPIPFFVSTLIQKVLRVKNLQFIKKDFLLKKYKEDEILVTYLYPKGMQKLYSILQKQNLETFLISVTFAIDMLEAQKIIVNDLFATPLYIYDLSMAYSNS